MALQINDLLKKALSQEFLSVEEGLHLYLHTPVSELMLVANELRKIHVPRNTVTWMIDRNVNITNICMSQCKFCNFCRVSRDADAYVTTIDEYRKKIHETFAKHGDQLLLQGGMHPSLGIDYYEDLFRTLKSEFPTLKLHALGPPEIHYLSIKEGLTYRQVLKQLRKAGMESLPGAGAEILSDRVRKIVSPVKCNTQQWLDVMREAHKLDMLTSATMMFGHVESADERIQHLVHLRQVQSEKPAGSTGFIAFIPWPFQDLGTVLRDKMGIRSNVSVEEYIRTIAISRIMLPNFNNIQSSWLTVGKSTAQITLHGGANDFGSIMIEENVVSAAGANNSFDVKGIKLSIREAGFEPQRRNQKYEFLPDVE